MFQVPAPNFTQTPNALFDEWLPKLGMAELKVLMVILRKTFGWHKIRDRISLSQLEVLTGMERRHITKARKSLVEKGLIAKITTGEKGEEETYYELVVIEDSNNSYQCPKEPGTGVLKTPTKETTPKETISPIVPKGDIAPRKSNRQEKIQRATEVWTTPVQHADLESRCRHEKVELQDCYNRLSAWKLGKEITGGKNDYKAMVNWVIDSVAKDKSPKPKREVNEER